MRALGCRVTWTGLNKLGLMHTLSTEHQLFRWEEIVYGMEP